MHSASLCEHDPTSGIADNADRSAKRAAGKMLVFLGFKIGLRQRLLGSRQSRIRVLPNQHVRNVFYHRLLSSLWQE
ncbi:hypothetical protein [Rhizobium sp. GCM10022189]|uniref:hypothetical protein n=1 Tax=Rhizobium sp. GCM10022189 TaxID=3252654 RepID=UPI00366BB004